MIKAEVVNAEVVKAKVVKAEATLEISTFLSKILRLKCLKQVKF